MISTINCYVFLMYVFIEVTMAKELQAFARRYSVKAKHFKCSNYYAKVMMARQMANTRSVLTLQLVDQLTKDTCLT